MTKIKEKLEDYLNNFHQKEGFECAITGGKIFEAHGTYDELIAPIKRAMAQSDQLLQTCSSQLQTIEALKRRLEGLTAKYEIDGRTTGLEGEGKDNMPEELWVDSASLTVEYPRDGVAPPSAIKYIRSDIAEDQILDLKDQWEIAFKRIQQLERQNSDLQANNTKLVLENRELKARIRTLEDL